MTVLMQLVPLRDDILKCVVLNASQVTGFH